MCKVYQQGWHGLHKVPGLQRRVGYLAGGRTKRVKHSTKLIDGSAKVVCMCVTVFVHVCGTVCMRVCVCVCVCVENEGVQGDMVRVFRESER